MKKLTNKTTDFNFPKIAGGVLTAGLLMFGTATFAQERENVGNTDVDEFGQYDANQDQQWDREEFDTRMNESETYNQWDTDRSGDISEDEFNEGFRNQQNNQDQAGQGMETQGTTNDQDISSEGTTTDRGVNTQGNTTGMNNQGTFQDWDTDQSGTIDQNEYNEGTYNQWDADRDGSLSTDEYNEGIRTYEGTNRQDTGMEGTEMNNEAGTETEIQNQTEETGTEIGNEMEETGTEIKNETEEIGTEIGNEAEETGTEIKNESEEIGTEIENETEEIGTETETETETQY